jgi:hypothetical protein
LSTAEGPRRATQRVAQRLGARRTSEERGIADHDGAQKHEERRRGQRGRERGSKEGQAGVSKDVQFTSWWVGGWRCRAPPTGFGGSTSLSTTFAHSPCGQHGCFAMTGGNPRPAVARRVRRGQRGLCACDCFVQRVQWPGDDDAMRCYGRRVVLCTRVSLPLGSSRGPWERPRTPTHRQDRTGQDRPGQGRVGCRQTASRGVPIQPSLSILVCASWSCESRAAISLRTSSVAATSASRRDLHVCYMSTSRGDAVGARRIVVMCRVHRVPAYVPPRVASVYIVRLST